LPGISNATNVLAVSHDADADDLVMHAVTGAGSTFNQLKIQR